MERCVINRDMTKEERVQLANKRKLWNPKNRYHPLPTPPPPTLSPLNLSSRNGPLHQSPNNHYPTGHMPLRSIAYHYPNLNWFPTRFF